MKLRAWFPHQTVIGSNYLQISWKRQTDRQTDMTMRKQGTIANGNHGACQLCRGFGFRLYLFRDMRARWRRSDMILLTFLKDRVVTVWKRSHRGSSLWQKPPSQSWLEPQTRHWPPHTFKLRPRCWWVTPAWCYTGESELRSLERELGGEFFDITLLFKSQRTRVAVLVL